jgi:SAM-dependent methyltransferase
MSDNVAESSRAPRYRLLSPNVLAEFRALGSEPEFWSNLWNSTHYDRFLRIYERGFLGEFDSVFRKYLPKTAPIVEAGCGRAQYVAALKSLGYDVIGVDFASDLVEAVRRVRPDMPVRKGDVRCLDVPDGSFGAYVSLGVIEHFWEDGSAILREAHRVLESGGLLLASVPHFSPALRRWSSRHLTGVTADVADLPFYQFYFTKDEWASRIQAVGFKPLDFFYYAPVPGARRAFPRFDTLYTSLYPLRLGIKVALKFRLTQRIQSQFAHMVMVIAQKV